MWKRINSMNTAAVMRAVSLRAFWVQRRNTSLLTSRWGSLKGPWDRIFFISIMRPSGVGLFMFAYWTSSS